MKLQKLNALFRLYEANFRNLHWNSKGLDFNDSHKSITSEYYEMMSDDIDVTAEMIVRLDENPLNYIEITQFIQEDQESKYLVVASGDLYDRLSIVKFADVMLGDICKCIEECLAEDAINAPENIGIKSDLETMHGKYDLQYRYINKRRMTE